MTASELMTEPVVMVRRDTSLAEVARTMVDRRVGCVAVVDKRGKLCGVITQTDFSPDEHGAHFSTEALLQTFCRKGAPDTAERARKQAHEVAAKDVMTTELITAAEDCPVEEVARVMLRYDVEHVPVVRGGVPVGMVARHDFLRMIAGERSAT